MAIARIDEFIEKLTPLTTIKDIKALCNQELDYLRKELDLKILYSNEGFPCGVEGDARRLNTQVSKYRKAIQEIKCNSRNSKKQIYDGIEVRKHKALEYFNLTKYERKDCSIRRRKRVYDDKSDRKSFNAIEVIDTSFKLLESNSYINKVAGLYLLTGRRHAEILITGKFDKTCFDLDINNLTSDWINNDIYSGLFSGQVKLKGQVGTPYNIPLLAPLELIQDSINWLRENKPHQPGDRPKGSKELGLKVRKVFQENNLLPLPTGKDLYLNPHNLRSAYSAICWQLFKKSEARLNCTEDLFVKEIMGHLEETTESAQAYLDYELNETEADKLVDRYYE